MKMIRLERVTKKFGAVEALRAVDLEIGSGEWLGLFGHNGSGKTTLIRILLGLSPPSSGEIRLRGETPNPERWLAFRRKLGFMPERVTFYEHLSGRDTLRYFCRLRGVDADEISPTLERVGLADAADRKVREYSKGMRQRLNLAQALLGRPEILVLDEPIEGLDPHGVRDFFRLLRTGEARTVVLSSHRLSRVGAEVDRFCILADGGIHALGSREDVLQSVSLPVRIHIYPQEAAVGTLPEAIARLGATLVLQKDGVLVAEVRQTEKISFLVGLDPYRAAIRHLYVEEPNLERVYFEGT